MRETEQEIVLLLEGVDSVESDLAKNLLANAGIPFLTKGPDFDVAELGEGVHGMVRGTDLYVPRSALELARSILKSAWPDKDAAGAD
jgi:hypothetical protein